jgi:myo-inositol-1(or 4)-monophosphatase
VDPIDGTRAFMEGRKSFSHALAVVENGVPVAGVVYLPMMDLMFAAARGQGATLNGKRLGTSSRLVLEGAEILGNKKMFDAALWGGPLPVTQHFRSSLAYRMSLVAQGAFDGMITLRPSWEWDIAAGDLIVREAGALVTDRVGAALRFNNTHPQVNGVLAAPRNVHEGLMARLVQPAT